VRVRIDRQKLNIPGSVNSSVTYKIVFACRNVQSAIILELKQDRKFRGPVRCEVHTDGGLNGFHFARRLQMRIQYKIVSASRRRAKPGGSTIGELPASRRENVHPGRTTPIQSEVPSPQIRCRAIFLCVARTASDRPKGFA